MKISFVATVLNEEKSINLLLDSLVGQTKQPNEIIIVDGGSTDGTIDLIQKAKIKNQKFKSKLKIIQMVGNRSSGRNEGIKKATGDIIAVSDAGCVLDKDWLAEVTKPLQEKDIEVVAGYYKGRAENIFQKCLIPYVLVMPDHTDPAAFLPASRSMAFRKSVWEKAKGFDTQYSLNEDYVFAKKLQKMKTTMVFNPDAIVYWIPRSTFADAYTMFYRFAQGDAQARIFRPKVLSIFLRYCIFLTILLLATVTNSKVFLLQFLILMGFYIGWSIQKNYKYVEDPKAIAYLPLLQFTSDFAVMSGTIRGVVR